MPDITMCKAVNANLNICPIRDKCYRFMAEPSNRQTWFTDAPFGGGDPRSPYSFCEHFWGYDGSSN